MPGRPHRPTRHFRQRAAGDFYNDRKRDLGHEAFRRLF